MRLPSSKLPPESRSVVRFLIVGNLGTCIQYALYYGFIELFPLMGWEGDFMVNVSFTVAYVLEMIYNYLGTSYYTFERKPDLKNAGGFLISRGINYVVQMGLLNLFMLFMNDKWAGIVAIVLSGVLNFFILRFVFKKKDNKKEESEQSATQETEL